MDAEADSSPLKRIRNDKREEMVRKDSRLRRRRLKEV